MRKRLRTHRRSDERGVTIVFLAVTITGLMTFAGLVVDGSNGFVQRRQMQNAADTSSLAGANALNRYLIGEGTALDIYTAALASAQANDADAAQFTCLLVRADDSTQPCPTAGNGLGVPSDAFRVRTEVHREVATTLMRVVGVDSINVAGTAAAAVQGLTGGSAPFMVCGIDDGLSVPIIDQIDGLPPEQWPINPDAIGVEYAIWGNDVKDTDCGNPSSSFRGLVDTDAGPFDFPGWWEGDQGNKTGPINQIIVSGDACSGDDDDFVIGCLMILPLCTAGNNLPGNRFQMYCTVFGAFRVTQHANHDLDAVFEGAAIVADGPAGGDPTFGTARVVRLVE